MVVPNALTRKVGLKTWSGTRLKSQLVKGASKIRAMVPITCALIFLKAATFPGISDQTHGVNNRKSQQILCIVVKEQFDIFDRKSF